jgi:hypothetical protein
MQHWLSLPDTASAAIPGVGAMFAEFASERQVIESTVVGCNNVTYEYLLIDRPDGGIACAHLCGVSPNGNLLGPQ